MSDEREYRIYVFQRGGEPVKKDIIGGHALSRALEEVAAEYPKDTIVVREVFESVVEVHNSKNDGKSKRIF